MIKLLFIQGVFLVTYFFTCFLYEKIYNNGIKSNWILLFVFYVLALVLIDRYRKIRYPAIAAFFCFLFLSSYKPFVRISNLCWVEYWWQVLFSIPVVSLGSPFRIWRALFPAPFFITKLVGANDFNTVSKFAILIGWYKMKVLFVVYTSYGLLVYTFYYLRKKNHTMLLTILWICSFFFGLFHFIYQSDKSMLGSVMCFLGSLSYIINVSDLMYLLIKMI